MTLARSPLRRRFAAPVPRSSARSLAGWALIGAAGLTPPLAWLGPLGFALLLGLVGLLSLPAWRIEERDRPLAIILLAALAWAAASSFWSPYRPGGLEESAALKLGLQLMLYWAVWQGARQVDAGSRRLILRIFAWGLAGLGVVLLAEALTDGAIYQALRDALHDPIRPDLARKNLAQASFVLALLWPVAAAGGARAGAPAWLVAPMVAGTAVLAQLFEADAPVLAAGLALAVGLLVWVWPRWVPRAAGVAAAAAILVMPVLVLAARFAGLGGGLPESWAQRMDYWTYAVGRIAEHPWRGWGLDASRAFGPNIGLHPHNGALQVWLELGAVGAAFTALAWAFAFRRLARDEPSLVAAAAAGSAAVYFFFGSVSFGLWQEWWLALGALTVAVAALADAEEAEHRN